MSRRKKALKILGSIASAIFTSRASIFWQKVEFLKGKHSHNGSPETPLLGVGNSGYGMTGNSAY